MVNPEERIVGVQKQDTDDPNFMYLMSGFPKYYCPICDDITVFKIDSKVSIELPKEVRDAFDEKTNIKEYEENYKDIVCRICMKPSRLVYSIDEFHMAYYRYYAKIVLEIIPR
uniref:hypothetical protein n=1 Tax=Candidatus Electrothrix sp. TaxID=2170559 RepID=UPI004055DBD0